MTTEDAAAFENQLLEIAERGKTETEETLHDLVFYPLHKNDSSILHQESKAYGSKNPSWLRMYAIRLAPNLYVITGGSIKLTKRLQEREHTNRELEKLKTVARYLKEIGFDQADDYGIMEIETQ